MLIISTFFLSSWRNTSLQFFSTDPWSSNTRQTHLPGQQERPVPLQKRPALEQQSRCFCRGLQRGKGTGTGQGWAGLFLIAQAWPPPPHTRRSDSSGAQETLCDRRGADLQWSTNWPGPAKGEVDRQGKSKSQLCPRARPNPPPVGPGLPTPERTLPPAPSAPAPRAAPTPR